MRLCSGVPCHGTTCAHSVIDYVRTRCHGRHAHRLSCPTWCSKLGEGESASRVFSDTHSHALDVVTDVRDACGKSLTKQLTVYISEQGNLCSSFPLSCLTVSSFVSRAGAWAMSEA
jgi:hypothetical protein